MRLNTSYLALLLLAPAIAGDSIVSHEPLVVHEWGTFTSVAGADGRAVSWAPLHGPGDLPCFVERLGPGDVKFWHGLVRMETPVLYFYAPQPVTLSVRVGFPRGWITEWFPKANRVLPSRIQSRFPESAFRNGSIEWSRVEVRPGENPALPGSRNASHYYEARNTDAAPVRVNGDWEKLLFYRGIGDFEPPLRPAYTPGGKLRIRNSGREPVPVVILFENRDGKIGYRVGRGLRETAEFGAPEMDGDLFALRRELAVYLVEFGLLRKEAEAMIETWRDSWFEPGTRVFYLVPRTEVDALLPLEIAPAPASTARVFVGRVELLSPWVRKSIEAAVRTGDAAGLAKFGRFLQPFAAQMGLTGHWSRDSRILQEAVGKVWRQQGNGPGCVE